MKKPTHSCLSGFIRQTGGVIRCPDCAQEYALGLRQRQILAYFTRFRNCCLDSFEPRNKAQRKALRMLREKPEGSYFIFGPVQQGKTHLLVSQFRDLPANKHCEIRTGRQLISELQDAETDPTYTSSVLESIQAKNLHLFWDDVDKISFNKSTFRAEVLAELVDEIWRNNLSITVTSNLHPERLQEVQSLHPAAARRLMDMCVLVEV